MAKRGKPKGAGPVSIATNTVKLFHKHIVEGKSVSACAREMDISRKTLHGYKKTEDFRHMAIEHLENSTLKGLTGTVSKLVKALDAKKPVVTENTDGSTNISMVPDQKTRMTALDQVIKIYGLHAPIQRNVTATISVSSDAELFAAIEVAERDCRYVQSKVKGEEGFGLVADEQGSDSRNFSSRGRAILLDDSVQEQD